MDWTCHSNSYSTVNVVVPVSDNKYCRCHTKNVENCDSTKFANKAAQHFDKFLHEQNYV